MKTKDLIRLGVPLGKPMDEAFKFISAFCTGGGDKENLGAEISAIVAAPGTFADDPLRGPWYDCHVARGPRLTLDPRCAKKIFDGDTGFQPQTWSNARVALPVTAKYPPDGRCNARTGARAALRRLGSTLRKWRLGQKLKIATIARRLGISEATWGHWESGRRFPSAENLILIADLTGILVAHLFCPHAERCPLADFRDKAPAAADRERNFM